MAASPQTAQLTPRSISLTPLTTNQMQLTINSNPVWITFISPAEIPDALGPEALQGTQPADLAGFYWAVCSPGCLPDSEFSGPFLSADLAEQDAADWLTD